MSGTEIAALISALLLGVAAIIQSRASVIAARANKARLDEMQTDLGKQKEENAGLEKKWEQAERVRLHQSIVLADLREQNKNWAEYGDKIGKMYNQLLLEFGWLKENYIRRGGNEETRKGDTHPLPPLPTSDKAWLVKAADEAIGIESE